MGVSFEISLQYFLAVFVCVQSQYYPFGQYGYTPYNYYPGQDYGYNPYSHQPAVSNQYSSYVPYYGYPVQNYAQQSYPVYNYPSQSYPVQNYPSQSSPAQNYPSQSYPYPYVYSQYINPQPVPYNTNVSITTTSSGNSTGVEEDPYANVKVDIIDVEPEQFHYYKRFFNLEDNAYPIVSDRSSYDREVTQAQDQPLYVVKSESRKSNYSNVPQVVTKHDVTRKTYSFKRTFTLDPNKKGSNVVRLNFVNGVQITTETPSPFVSDQEVTTEVPVVTEPVSTTTESDEPANILSWV